MQALPKGWVKSKRDFNGVSAACQEKNTVYWIKQRSLSLLIPEEYSVIATLNLNGDYVSDQLAAMVGGIGIAPGANINYQTGHAIFEATHGTAPNIAGKDVVNPCSIILSAVMMLEYFDWKEAAALIEKALEQSFLDARATHDLARFMPNGTSLSTSAFTREIVERIEKQK